MDERTAHRHVEVLDDEEELRRPGGRCAPGERGREVAAADASPAVLDGHAGTVGEGHACDRERLGRPQVGWFHTERASPARRFRNRVPMRVTGLPYPPLAPARRTDVACRAPADFDA